MEEHELERIRRSVAMLPPGHSAGALTKETAEELIEEVSHARAETARYRRAVAQLRSVLDALTEE